MTHTVTLAFLVPCCASDMRVLRPWLQSTSLESHSTHQLDCWHSILRLRAV